MNKNSIFWYKKTGFYIFYQKKSISIFKSNKKAIYKYKKSK